MGLFYMRKDIVQLTRRLERYNVKPTSFMEIGSRDGWDANYVMNYWKIPTYIIEPHPTMVEIIKVTYPNIPVYEFAASNKNGTAKFNAIHSDNMNQVGMSSLLLHTAYNPSKDFIDVITKRMDTFLEEEQLNIDLVKIDVEGFAYEVLEGFGNKLQHIKAIQVETEQIPNWFQNGNNNEWIGQKVHRDVVQLLKSYNFKLEDMSKEWDTQLACLFINQQ